jgi:hypothetical protein
MDISQRSCYSLWERLHRVNRRPDCLPDVHSLCEKIYPVRSLIPPFQAQVPSSE